MSIIKTLISCDFTRPCFQIERMFSQNPSTNSHMLVNNDGISSNKGHKSDSFIVKPKLMHIISFRLPFKNYMTYLVLEAIYCLESCSICVAYV